jgi:uncharacterized protein involved in outer membrane biogenesis
MRRLLRWFFRAVLALAALALIVAVAGILLADTLAREFLVSRLRSRTGMEVKISAVHVGLLSPTISIDGFKLYNSADFGGSLCLDVPELHIEYDPAALRSRQLHLTLMRLNLADFSMVWDKQGRMNFDAIKEKSKNSSARKKQPDRFKFVGIDILNVTLGKFHLSHLVSGRTEVIDFGPKNQILRNVKTDADLAPLGLGAVLHDKFSASGAGGVNLSQWLESLLDAH